MSPSAGLPINLRSLTFPMSGDPGEAHFHFLYCWCLKNGMSNQFGSQSWPREIGWCGEAASGTKPQERKVSGGQQVASIGSQKESGQVLSIMKP